MATSLESKSAHTCEKVNTGWVFLWNATRAHYFGADGRSLCGKWLYLGRHDRTGDGVKSPDDCKACTRKLASLTAKLIHGSLVS